MNKYEKYRPFEHFHSLFIMLNSAVGVQIGLRRRQRDLTAAELARRSGVSKATLSAIEAGNGNPTLENLMQLP